MELSVLFNNVPLIYDKVTNRHGQAQKENESEETKTRKRQSGTMKLF